MNSDFHIRAMEWIRTKEKFATQVLPDDRLDERDGWERIEGFIGRGKGAGHWLVAGLWAELFGSMFVMANLPGFTRAIHDVTERIGVALLVTGAVCFVAAEIARRTQRTPAVLGLRAQAAGPVTPEAIAAFCGAAEGRPVWIMAEGGFTSEGALAAGVRRVRCFVPEKLGFREVDTTGATSEPFASEPKADTDAQSTLHTSHAA